MYYSLCLYYVVLIIVSSFNYLEGKFVCKGFFSLCSFVVLFLLASLRVNIGTDYNSYKIIYNTIEATGDFNTEIGFLWLNKLLISSGMPFGGAIAVYSFLTLFFVYKATPRKYLLIVIFLYIASNSYFQSFCLIRQSLSVAIALYAIKYINKKQFYFYLPWIILSASIHLSSILFLFVYFFRYISVNRFYAFLLLIFCFIVNSTKFVSDLFTLIVSLTPYEVYIGGSFYTRDVHIGLGVLFRILLGIIVLFRSNKIKAKFPEANIYLLLLFIYELAYIMSLDIYIFTRLADTFSLFYIFVIPYFIDSFNKKYKTMISSVVVVLFLIFMWVNNTNDYKQIKGGIGVVPYESFVL